jgi:hypothetical protein
MVYLLDDKSMALLGLDPSVFSSVFLVESASKSIIINKLLGLEKAIQLVLLLKQRR